MSKKKKGKGKGRHRQKTMTEAALNANRENAQHSTGPKTEPGKAAASKNAQKDGSYSRDFLDDESPEEFAEIETQLVALLQPSNVIESIYLQDFLWGTWQVFRNRRLYNKSCRELADNPDKLRREKERLSKVQTRLMASRDRGLRRLFEHRGRMTGATKAQVDEWINEFVKPPAMTEDEKLAYFHEMARRQGKTPEEAGLPPLPEAKMGSFREDLAPKIPDDPFTPPDWHDPPA